MLYGVDVSKWQGSIDWKKVKDSNIDFAMIRASYGLEGVDPNFVTNVRGSNQVGISAGAYHYSYAKTTEESLREAKHFLKLIERFPFQYPLALDMEDQSQAGLGKELLTDIANVFLTALEQNGYYAMLYANKYWLENKFNMERLKKFDIWLAEYGVNRVDYDGAIGMWQFTNSGLVDGINGYVDRNKSFKDYAKIIREAGLNHWGENNDMTLEEAKKIIQDKCGFDSNTMLYLEFYRYSESMITRLAEAMQ